MQIFSIYSGTVSETMITKKEIINILRCSLIKTSIRKGFFLCERLMETTEEKKTLKLVALSWIAGARRVILTFESKYGGQFTW